MCWSVFQLILAFLSFQKTFGNFVKVISLDNKDFSRNFDLLHTRQVHDQWIYLLRQQHFIFQPTIFYLHQIQLLRYFHIHSIFEKKWPDKVVKSNCNGKIGSPFMIYVFYFKDCHLQSSSSRSYCSQVFSRTTALKVGWGTAFCWHSIKCNSEKFKGNHLYQSLFNKATGLRGSGQCHLLWILRGKNRKIVQHLFANPPLGLQTAFKGTFTYDCFRSRL